MELVTVYEIYLDGESKEVRVGLMDGDSTMQITRIEESNNALECYAQVRQTEQDEWSQEFLGATYVNMPYSKFQMLKGFLEEGEVF